MHYLLLSNISALTWNNSASDVLVDVEAVEGWAAQEDGGYLSLLQIELDDDLQFLIEG